MGTSTLPDALFGSILYQPITSSRRHHAPIQFFVVKSHSTIYRRRSGGKRVLFADAWLCKPRHVVLSSMDDSTEALTDFLDDGDDNSLGRGKVVGIDDNELLASRKALSDAQARNETIEKERDQLLEKLARSEAKQKEYLSTVMHDKDLAISELEAAKALFNRKLEESVEERFNLESKLVLAKEDAVELAVQVEKFAEIAFQQATSHILEDAQLRVSAAETSAAEAAFQIVEQIRTGSEGAITYVLQQSKDAIEKALAVAESAGDHTTNAMAAFVDNMDQVDEIISVQSQNLKLSNTVNDLESQLLVYRNEIDRLKLELKQARKEAKAYELHANDVEKLLLEFQESSRKAALQQEEEIKSSLERMRKDATEKKKAASKAFKLELGRMKAAIEAAKETTRSQDEAYMRRCEALQRSLRAAEAASKTWRQRAEMAAYLLLRKSSSEEVDEEAIYCVNGGRIDFLMDDDSQKWRLLTDGPRRPTPEWMARRIRSIRPRFPPRKTHVPEVMTSGFKTLDLPKPDEVWSIAQEKLKEGDALVEHVIEKEVIEKKRKALERALQRKTVKWQRTPEETKLESGTGTGREIVFQGFNWESWRRQWYLELANKAADLSRCGITAVWLPPPTESVAPQGYMPSDLYNLNSAYGSLEELRSCIEEMHHQGLLALGDIVLNHRCAHKQSPNGVWNIFGGKLAWGPEAIVCDDPNFRGRGNPSSGDIFHAAPNIDHSQEFVREDIKKWLNWLRNDVGFDGWRLDFVRGYIKEYIEASNPAFSIGEYWDSLAYEGGNLCYNQDAHRQRIVNWINATVGSSSAFDVTTKANAVECRKKNKYLARLKWRRNNLGFSGGYIKEYIEASNPAFSIGEYWDSLAYEGGNLCYNQDAHRQRIVNWINATVGSSSAFDVTTKGILHSALHNQYWRLIDPQGKPTGVMGWWPSRAVTFLENHDTGSTQGHWPFPRDKLTQGYAYILTHPGTPVIFYDHFYDFGIRDIINELIEARRRAGIHCRSNLKIYHANNDGYVAQIGDSLVMKLGHLNWNPSKEVHLDGTWQKFVDKGPEYQIWLRQ